MNSRDPVDVDLDRFLTTQEEDYVDPYELKQARDEWLADNEPDDYED